MLSKLCACCITTRRQWIILILLASVLTIVVYPILLDKSHVEMISTMARTTIKSVTVMPIAINKVAKVPETQCPLVKSNLQLPGKAIPKIFHQTYKNTMPPNAYRKCISKCRNLNPDWQYFLWRDEDIVSFISEYFPQYMAKYRKFTMKVQRADFIRYMVLYRYGGIYLDMDVECVKPFFPDLERFTAFLDQERLEHSQILYQREYTAMNSAMGSVPGHPYFIRMLESINSASDSLQGAGITTGPDRLTLVYQEWLAHPACSASYPITMLDPVFFSPIVDVMLHNFKSRCTAAHRASNKWIDTGCQLMQAKDWRVDSSDNRTVAKHLFLHMGYSWGPKSHSYFDVRQLGPVKLYNVDRMQPLVLNKN